MEILKNIKNYINLEKYERIKVFFYSFNISPTHGGRGLLLLSRAYKKILDYLNFQNECGASSLTH